MSQVEGTKIYGGDQHAAWLLYPEADLEDKQMEVNPDFVVVSFEQLDSNEDGTITIQDTPEQRGWRVSSAMNGQEFWIDSTHVTENQYLSYLAQQLEELAGKKVVILLK